MEHLFHVARVRMSPIFIGSRIDVAAPDHHGFVLDEFRTRPRVDCVHALLNQGRFKGVSVLPGFSNRRKRRLFFRFRGDTES